MLTKNKPATWLALLLTFGLLGAACSDDDDEPTASDDGGEATEQTAGSDECPTDVEGEVIISGSSTVEPITAHAGDLLEDCGSGVLATVDGPGTGDGFELFCNDETDISDASRPISEEEIAACEEAGVEFIELKLGIDGITVLTNPANEVECLSFADLYALLGPESEDFEDWADAQALATELGSTTTFPDAPLDVFGPGEESGTYDSFAEIVLGDVSEARAEAGEISEEEVETTRKSYSSQADDNAIVAGIEGSDSSLGWVGFAFAEEAGDEVREIAISEEPGGTCVAPTAETIASNEYPISRNLYIYVNAAQVEENPAVEAYVDFLLGDDGIASVTDQGYVALTAEDLEATRTVWEAKETGTREG